MCKLLSEYNEYGLTMVLCIIMIQLYIMVRRLYYDQRVRVGVTITKVRVISGWDRRQSIKHAIDLIKHQAGD